MRIVSALFAILAFAAAAPQDTLDLHMRYGQPGVERFDLRQDVTLTAEYGPSGQPCRLKIKPRRDLISRDTMFDVLSEVAPPDLREKGQLDNSIGIYVSRYSLLVVRRPDSEIKVTSVDRGTIHGVESAEVQFESPECSNTVRAAPNPNASLAFHARYGEASFERFVAGPDVALSVEYSLDKQPCWMRIEQLHEATGALEKVTAMLEEIVPLRSRGRELGQGKVTGIPFPGKLSTTEYENATVDPYYGIAVTPATPSGLEILFKRPACQSLPEHSEN